MINKKNNIYAQQLLCYHSAMTQKKLAISAVLLKGFTSIIIQTLLIRELFIVFFGNELTFAIILTTWLLSSALGGGIIANIFKKTKDPFLLYCVFQLILSITIPASAVFIRCSRAVLNVPFGEIFSLGNIIAASVISLGLTALLDGCMFITAFRLMAQDVDKKSSAMAKIYFFESIGLIIGGIAFTFAILPFFNTFQTVFLVSCANLLIGLLLLKKTNGGLFVKMIFHLALFACLACFFLSSQIQKKSLAVQWHNKNILAYDNSPFGNITATEDNNQYTIFYDGLPVLTLPTGDAFFIEDFIHIPMLLNPEAESILFIGHAAGGLIQETLKYPKNIITYCEIDPVFIKTLLRLKNKQIKEELNHPRVFIQLTDGRSFIKTAGRAYDMIFVNVGLPTSLSINRYYTKEFFEELKKRLNPRGLVILKTWGTLTCLSGEFKTMNAIVYKTINNVFNHLVVIPGDGFNLLIASNEIQNMNAKAMIERYHGLGIKTSLINENYLAVRLNPNDQHWFFNSIRPELKHAVINQDLKPAGLYTALRLYYAQFSIKIPALLETFKKIKPIHIAFFLAAFFVFLRRPGWQKTRVHTALTITALSSGLFAMSTQITILFLFQSLLGILFQWLAILTAGFMAGISVGTLITDKKLKQLTSLKILGLIECFLPLAITLLMLFTVLFFHKVCHLHALKWLFSIFSFLTGGIIGLEMPVIFALITQYMPAKKPLHVSAGYLYGLDLAGACVGAMITPLILIPNCGIITTILLMCLFKIINGINLYICRR